MEHEDAADDRDWESNKDSDSEAEASFEEKLSPEELQELCNEEGSLDTASTAELSGTKDDSADEDVQEEPVENRRRKYITVSNKRKKKHGCVACFCGVLAII